MPLDRPPGGYDHRGPPPPRERPYDDRPPPMDRYDDRPPMDRPYDRPPPDDRGPPRPLDDRPPLDRGDNRPPRQCPPPNAIVTGSVEINHWFGGPPPNFRTL
jgi:hypothetical protein